MRTLMPVARPVAISSDSIRDFFAGVFRARSLTAQNRALHDQLDSLALYSEHVDLLNQQIDVLRSQLALKPLPGHDRLNLDVIGFNMVEGQVTLDGGSERGIQSDMPVVNGEGLVGVVTSVSRGESQVVLLTSFGVKVGGDDISRKPPERGLVQGRGGSTVTMEMFDPKAPVSSGDQIVTGGLSARIPYGIPIGRVITVEDDPDIGTRRATIDPAVNIGTLREVQILK